MTIYTFLTTLLSHIIKKVRTEASVDQIWEFLHDLNEYKIERGIQANYIWNTEDKLFGHNSMNKRVMAVQG